jgi:hypothetical protein
MTFQELKQRSNDFVANLEVHLIEVIHDNENKIIAMNQEQMQAGKTSKGGKIGRLRNPFYARQKIDNGGVAPFGDVDLLNTGAFQSKMMLWTDGKTYEIGSTDSKETDLVGKYGPEMFGLMPTFQDDARDLTGKSLAEKYKKLVLK